MVETQEIKANIPKLITRIRSNYEARREPVLVEPIQNSQDAYANALAQGRFEEERDLHIAFQVLPEKNRVIIQDDAGGMTKKEMEKVIPEIDTTSEAKEGGGSVGSMGRGLIAVAAATEKMYIETLNTDGERLATVIYPAEGEIGKPTKPREIASDEDENIIQDGPKISTQPGTHIILEGVDNGLSNTDVMSTLLDWEEVEGILEEIFMPLISRDDIFLTYIIEGEDSVERYIPDIPRLDDLYEEVVHKKETHTFTALGEEYTIRDLTFARASRDYPWDGIAMFKGNEYFDDPVMRVDHYYAEIPSLQGDNPKMIAWCRIDDCAELEDPSHQKLQIDNSRTDLKEPAQTVHADYFAEESASQEKEITNLLQDTVNQAVDSLDDDVLEDLANYDREGTLTVEVESTGGGEEETENKLLHINATEYPYEPGEVELEARVTPPKTPDVGNYNIYDITFEQKSTERVIELETEFDVEAAPDDIRTQAFSTEIEEEGWYWVSAKIAKVPIDLDDRDHWEEFEREAVEEGGMMIPVGVEPTYERDSGRSGGGGGGGSEGQAGEDEGNDESKKRGSVFHDTNEIDDTDDPRFARAHLSNEGGFTVFMNKQQSQWLEILEDSARAEEQKERLQEFGSKRIVRAIVEDLEHKSIKEVIEESDDDEEMRKGLYNVREEHEKLYCRLTENVENVVG